MRRNFKSVSIFVVFVISLSGLASAQTSRNKTASSTRDLYVISAKAGGVNYVEGKVALNAQNKKSGYLLKGDVLEVGDEVSTGPDGKAEILLNPGSYVRLAENSNFEFATTALDDLRLKLNSGSAVFEVITNDDFKIAVNTPKTQFLIATSGIYRVSVLKDGSEKIVVWKGKAQIGDANATTVKSGREATVAENRLAVAKFDRDEKTALEDWSKTRAKDLAKVNSRLQRPDLRSTLISGFGASRWNMYNSYGLWVFDASFGGYCFLPFGYGWSSPYGYGYGRDIWYFRLPGSIYYQPPSNSGGTVVAGGSGRTKTIINPPMPYEGIQRRVKTDIGESSVDNSPFPSRQSTPSVVVSPAASVPRTKSTLPDNK